MSQKSLSKVTRSAPYEARAGEELDGLRRRFRGFLEKDAARGRRPPLGEAHGDLFAGRMDDAFVGYAAAARRRPGDRVARVGLAVVCLEWSSDEDAAVALGEAADAVPAGREADRRLKADLLAAAGLCWLAVNRPDVAADAFRSARAVVPGHPAASFGLAEAARR